MPKDKKVYVVGMKGLEEELDEEGIQHIGGTVRASHFSVFDAEATLCVLTRSTPLLF